MKRFILIAFIGLMAAFTTDTLAQSAGGGITKRNGQKVNWYFPDSLSGNYSALFPTFASVTKTYASTVAVDAEAFYQYVNLGTLTGNTTVNVSIAPEVTPGAMLYLYSIANDQRTITCGTGIDCAVFTTDSVKYQLQTFIYNGSVYQKIGAANVN